MMSMNPPLPASAVALLSAALLAALSGCAAIRPAEMALPAALAAATPETVQGLGGTRQGRFSLGAQAGSFRRGLDRLSLFELVSFDRASTRYTLERTDGSTVQAACRGRQTRATLGVLSAQPRPFTLECEWSGALAARMTLAAPSAIPGTQSERSGSFQAPGLMLTLNSVHRVQGSPLPLDAPIGYLISHEGRPVGAIELNGGTPRLWRPAAGDALHEPVGLAALALALLWDPANAAAQ